MARLLDEIRSAGFLPGEAPKTYAVSARPFNADTVFTISARSKPPDQPVLPFLAKNYGSVPIAQIDSLFGFVEGCTLYGGRVFGKPEIYPHDIAVMYDVGLGLRIPLTNHLAEEPEYEQNLAFLKKYHRPGNAVIVTNDNLATWIRRDFPHYRIEASVIKNINSYAKIDEALEIYDTVVLPMEMCEQPEFLEKIEDKNRITLFANAGCALTCPARICYMSVSKINKGRNDTEWRCSQPIKERETRGMIDFDLERLSDLGFRRFKLLRSRPGGKTGV